MQNPATWRKNRIRTVNRDFTVISDGLLSREDYNILFENGTGKRYIPRETTGTINVYSDILFSGNFFRYMDQSGIRVNLFDKYGRFNGMFMPSENPGTGKTLLKQAALYMDTEKRKEIAGEIESAAIHNIRSNLKYYDRRKNEGMRREIKEMDKILNSIGRAKSINAMMMLEAKARKKYYGAFNKIMNREGFEFRVRSKRPPMDPVNALISFGNTCLYAKVASEIVKTSLDIRIGFLHVTGDRSMSLNLDIAEIFKPVIVDRTIFTVVNKGMLDAEMHFRKDDETGGTFLNREGREIFLRELETKLNLSRETGGRSMTYLARIKQEIGNFNRMVSAGGGYKAFRYAD